MINRLLIKLKYVCVVFLLFFSTFSYADSFKDSLSINFNGCVNADYLFWNGNKHDEFIQGGYLRSVELFTNGFLLNNAINYFLQFNITNYSYNDILSQSYIKFSYKNLNIKVGKFFLPFGLEQACTTFDKMYLETSLLHGMGDGEFWGISFDFLFDKFCFLSSIVVPDLKLFLNNDESFKYIFSFRTFSNFFNSKNFVFHVGLDYKRIEEDQKYYSQVRTIQYRDNPSFKTKSSLLNSYNGVILSSDLIDIELALMCGSLFFQTELGFVDVGWRDFDKEVYSSFYFQFSYFLNGNHHLYDSYKGCFTNPEFFSSYGAIELLFKYCIVNMINYGPLLMGYCQTDGKKESLLFGINWFISKNFKLQLNFVVDEFLYCKSPGFQITGVGFRLQFVY